MLRVDGRSRSQPAPAHVVFEALTDPNRAQGRQWFALESGEVIPHLLRAIPDETVEWSSLWPNIPEARITFTITAEESGCTLGFFIEASEGTDPATIEEMRRRTSQLVNRDLRMSFGQ